MKTATVDVAVIGAGTAGLVARREAAKAGASVVMIESGAYGTTCARVGCMPSKLLIAAADIAHEIGGAHRFGIEVPQGKKVNGPEVLDRVRRERDRFVGFVVEATEELPAEQRLMGHARFLGPNTLQVGDHTRVEARAIVIATGSHPWIPPSLEPVRDRVMVNDDVFELADLPASVAVVGTGIIGLELGQALHRLGVRTTLFSHTTRIGPLTDPEVEAEAASVLGSELSFHLDVELSARPAPDGRVALTWKGRDGAAGDGVFDKVLAAAGRRPNLVGLDLDRAGVALDPGGVPVHDRRTLQCGTLPIFIAGDASADRSVLHEAADEGRIAGRNAARFPNVLAGQRRVPLAIVFTDPQIAMVGKAFRELSPDEFEIGTVDYEDQGRARVMGKNAGRVRVYAERERNTFVGAEMFGPRVENTAHLLAWAAQSRMSVGTMLDMPFYHPVVEEGLRTALGDLCSRLRLAARSRPKDLECGPGT